LRAIRLWGEFYFLLSAGFHNSRELYLYSDGLVYKSQEKFLELS